MKEAVDERICLFCSSKQIEDEPHFMLECRVYEDLRETMWRSVEEATECSRDSFASNEQKLNGIIGDHFQPKSEEDASRATTDGVRTNNRPVGTADWA